MKHALAAAPRPAAHAVPPRAARADTAWTEAARTAAVRLWSERADELRSHRTAARCDEARAAALALQALRGVVGVLTLHPGDLVAARHAVVKARLRLQRTAGLAKAGQEAPPVFERTAEALAALEAFLAPAGLLAGTRPGADGGRR
ncbi:hypothetical protein [Sinomonas halotolerans]|uniref:SAV-6107-like HEPN domain-containing protein n=1 Tax=Sinomonas halotolerans TaxID=1644133 RepID=A0ABU9X2Q4_9MICC